MGARSESFLQSLGFSIFWNGATRGIGIIKQVAVAVLIGLSAELDSFYLAVSLLGILVFSWGQVLDLILVPRLVELRKKGDEAELERMLGGTLSAVLLAALVLLALIFLTREWIPWVAGGFDPERKELLKSGLLYLAPVVLLYLPGRFLLAVLRSKRRFSRYYSTELISEAIILFVILIFHDRDFVLFWSFGIGMAASVLFAAFSVRHLSAISLGNPFSAEVRITFRRFPSILGLSLGGYLFTLVDRYYMSFLPPGGVGALAYGLAAVMLIPGLLSISGGLATVLSESMGMPQKKWSLLNDAFSLSIYVGVPAMLFLAFNWEQAVRLFLQHGAFNSENTKNVGLALVGYLPMIIPLLLMRSVDQVFVIEDKARFLTMRMLIGVCINAVLNAFFLFVLKWGVFGVALASSISYWMMMLVAFGVLGRLGFSIAVAAHLKWGLWLAASSAIYIFIWRNIGSGYWPDYSVIISMLIFAIFILGVSIVYPGKEKVLVRNTIRRIARSASNRT